MFCCSDPEASLRVPQPPVSGVRAAVVQPVRAAEEHAVPRGVAHPHAQVRDPAADGPAVPVLARPVHHPLGPQAREHPPLQPQEERHQDHRLRLLLPDRTAGLYCYVIRFIPHYPHLTSCLSAVELFRVENCN